MGLPPHPTVRQQTTLYHLSNTPLPPTLDLPTVILEPAVAEVEYDTEEGTASIPVTCSAEDSNPPAQVSCFNIQMLSKLLRWVESTSKC